MLVNAKSLRIALENTLLGFLYENSLPVYESDQALKMVRSISTDILMKTFKNALKNKNSKSANLVEHYENYLTDTQNGLKVLNEGLNNYKINNIAKNNLLHLYEAYVSNDTIRNRDVIKTLHETYQRRVHEHPVLEKFKIVKEIYNGFARRFYTENNHRNVEVPSLYPLYSSYLIEPRFLSHYVCSESVRNGDTLKDLKNKVYNSLDYLMDKYLSENNLLGVFGVFHTIKEWNRFFE